MTRRLVSATFGGVAMLALFVVWYLSSDNRLATAWEIDPPAQVIPEATAGKQVEATFRLRNVSSRSLRICGANVC